jgi:hypothetical protein
MVKKIVLAAALLVTLPLAARAAANVSSIGPRVGVSVDPDQLVVGGQLSIGPVAKDLTFDPNLELGFGDNETVTEINLDLHYHLRLSGSDWSPYVGFGLGVAFIGVDEPAPFRDRSDTNVGANLIFGTQLPTSGSNKFLAELKLGLGDIPSLKIMVGWNFPLGH